MALFKLSRYLDIRNIYADIVKKSTTGGTVQKLKFFTREKIQQMVAACAVAREKLKDIPGTNFNLGLHHLRHGNLDDAILRFKMVIYLTPEKAEAYYNLGKCLIMKGDTDSARTTLEKGLALKPDFPEIQYLISKITSPESIGKIPESVIAEHMRADGKATGSPSGEQGDKLLVAAVLTCIKDKNPNLEVLDLGHGTGRRGKSLKNREVTRRIIGVDISTTATDTARTVKLHGENVYDNVYTSEISRFLADNHDQFDLILAGNIFSYQGKLDSMFADIFRSLKQGGIFAFTIKDNNCKSGYNLDIALDSFLHSAGYFHETLVNTGFTIEHRKTGSTENAHADIVIAAKPS